MGGQIRDPSDRGHVLPRPWGWESVTHGGGGERAVIAVTPSRSWPETPKPDMLSGCADAASSTEGRPTPIASLVAESGGVPVGSDVVTSGWLRAADDELSLCPTNAEGPCPEDGLITGGVFADLDADEYSRELPGHQRVVVAGTLAADSGAAMLHVSERLDADPDDRVYGAAVTVEVSAEPTRRPMRRHFRRLSDGTRLSRSCLAIRLGSTCPSVASTATHSPQRAEINDVDLRSDSGGVLVLNDAPCGSAESCVAGAVDVDTTRAKAGVYRFSLPVTWQQGQRSGGAQLDGEMTLTPAQGREQPSGS